MKSAKIISINDQASLQNQVERLNQRLANLQDMLNNVELNAKPNLDRGLLVATKGKRTFVRVKDILFIKAESNYSKIFLESGESLFTSKTLKFWLQKFNSSLLIRVHQTYLVNFEKVLSIDSNQNVLLLKDFEIPISRSMKSKIKKIVIN